MSIAAMHLEFLDEYKSVGSVSRYFFIRVISLRALVGVSTLSLYPADDGGFGACSMCPMQLTMVASLPDVRERSMRWGLCTWHLWTSEYCKYLYCRQGRLGGETAYAPFSWIESLLYWSLFACFTVPSFLKVCWFLLQAPVSSLAISSKLNIIDMFVWRGFTTYLSEVGQSRVQARISFTLLFLKIVNLT